MFENGGFVKGLSVKIGVREHATNITVIVTRAISVLDKLLVVD